MASITIDLTPYDVKIEPQGMSIIGCEGSLLSKLEKPSKECWTRYYGSHVGDSFVQISYGDGSCFFETTNIEDVAEWISQNYDRIESIDYETLEHLH